MNDQILEQFRKILGECYVLTDEGSLKAFGSDWTRVYEPKPSCVLLPGSTADIAALVGLCNQHHIAVVPSGGRTGLAGGAVASNGEVVISLNRMNKILRVDPVGMNIEVEAGVTTQALQMAADEVGLFFAIDLAAKGSCQIGGNIATNAGGVKFIRYAGTREQVLGLEVVLPSGKVMDLNTSLRKNNTGYDLKQFFIGSEGTLGIITKATLKLVAKPRHMQLSVMAVERFADVPKILVQCNSKGAQVTAFEFFTRKAHEIVLKHAQGARTPFAEMHPFYVLLEVEEGLGGAGVMEPLLETLFEEGLISDAVMASSAAQVKELWGLRENITESIAAHGHVRKNDVALAIDQLEDFISGLEEDLLKAPETLEVVVFGHIGDGNLHINYTATKDVPVDTFRREAEALEKVIFTRLKHFKGSISAEHGIGLLKKKDLGYSRTPDEIELMRAIKVTFDPRGIMNPGKIFDL